MHKTINPMTALPPLQALRNTTPKHSCQALGICQHPTRSCSNVCLQDTLMKPLAPGVVTGPHRKTPARLSRFEHLSRALLGGLGMAALVVVLAHIGGYLP